jgi:hypothetical protein
MGSVEAKSKRTSKSSTSRSGGRNRRRSGGKVGGIRVSQEPRKERTPAQLAADAAGRERLVAARAKRLANRQAGTGEPDSSQETSPEPIERAAPARSFPTNYPTGFEDGDWQDGGVRGRVFLCGKPNSGKSYLLCERVRNCRRVIIFNTAGVKSFDKLGWQQVSTPEELEKICYEANKAGNASVRVVYTPLAGDRTRHFEACNRIVMCYGAFVYAVDEVDSFMQPNFMPPEMYEVVNYGRHHDVAMIATARNSAQVARQYTSMLTEICVFCMTEPIYLKYFESTCGPETAAKIPTLAQHNYVRWMSTGENTVGKGWR